VKVDVDSVVEWLKAIRGIVHCEELCWRGFFFLLLVSFFRECDHVEILGGYSDKGRVCVGG